MTVATQQLDDGRLTVSRDFVWLLHRSGLDTFEAFYAKHAGALLRDLGVRANVRMTLAVEGESITCFMKRHAPLSFAQQLGAWLRLRRPRTPARVEWENIARLEALGIPTMRPVAMGEDRATGRSLIVVAEVPGGVPADDYAAAHFAGTAHRARAEFARALGALVQGLHVARLTHRDLYLCHVFVRETADGPALHLIDLQRLGPRLLLRRWRIKDIAQLAHSLPEGTFTRTDAVRFIRAYFDVPRLGARERRFVTSVLRKAARIGGRERRREGAS